MSVMANMTVQMDHIWIQEAKGFKWEAKESEHETKDSVTESMKLSLVCAIPKPPASAVMVAK